MKWKVGDKVRMKNTGYNYTITIDGTEGVIESLHNDYAWLKITKLAPSIALKMPYEIGKTHEVSTRYFEIIKIKTIKNDIEWLDAIKDNFKNG